MQCLQAILSTLVSILGLTPKPTFSNSIETLLEVREISNSKISSFCKLKKKINWKDRRLLVYSSLAHTFLFKILPRLLPGATPRWVTWKCQNFLKRRHACSWKAIPLRMLAAAHSWTFLEERAGKHQQIKKSRKTRNVKNRWSSLRSTWRHAFCGNFFIFWIDDLAFSGSHFLIRHHIL